MTALSITDRYPYFSAGQILKHSDLNDLIAYLDKQNRLTRGYAIGSGIISPNGLLPKANVTTATPPEINITEGVGLSSDGYLFSMLTNRKFTHYKEVEIFSNAFTSLEEEDRYKGDLTKFPVHELSDNDDDDFELLPLKDSEEWKALKEKVVVVLWYREEKERIPCFNECDEKGSDRFVFFKVVLVDKSDLPVPKNDDSTNGDTTANTITADPFINRLIPAPVPPADKPIEDFEGLHDSYFKICELAIDQISSAYTNAASVMEANAATVKKANAATVKEVPVSFVGLKDQLKNILTKNFTNISNTQIGTSNIQYFYDYLKDLVLAFEEFADATCDVANLGDKGLLDLTLHPGHIKLGVLGDTTQCRDSFIASVLQKEKEDPISREKLQFLFDRMKVLTKNIPSTNPTAVLFPQNKKEIKITPSKGLDTWLSERAIPFYYNLNNPQAIDIRSKWNFRISRKKHTDRIPAYDLIGENRLLRDADAYNFFRIEGIWGKKLEETIEKLEELRAKLNLSFDIQCVKLEPNTEFFQSYLFEEFEDLQLIYSKAKGELVHTLEEMTQSPNSDFSKEELERLLPSTIRAFAKEINYFLFKEGFRKPFPAGSEKKEYQLDIFDEIIETYQKRINAKSFTLFAQEHPGLEHQGGVVKGGTLILAYVDDYPPGIMGIVDIYKSNKNLNSSIHLDDANNRLQPFEQILEEIDRNAILLQNINIDNILRRISNFRHINIPMSDLLKIIHQHLEDAEEKVTQKIVGDFCLPYQCCDTLLKNSQQIIEPTLFLLPGSFCKGDTKRYEIITYPPGGELNAFTVINDDEHGSSPTPYLKEDEFIAGRFYFLPVQVPDFTTDTQKIKLSYSINGKTATQSVEIRQGVQVATPTILSRKPIFDAAKNCEMVAMLFRYKIEGFNSEIKYAYVLDGEVHELDGEVLELKEGFFQIQVPIPDIESTFELVAKDDINCDGSTTVTIPKAEFCLPKHKTPTIKIIDLPDEIYSGQPDELTIVVSPVGGKLSLKTSKDQEVDAHIHLLGDCKDSANGTYKLETMNLDPGDYFISYKFPVCNVEVKVDDPITVLEPLKGIEDAFVLLEPRVFKNTDDNRYQIITYPPDGNLELTPAIPEANLIKEKDGNVDKYFFKPLGLTPQVITLKYTNEIDEFATQEIEVFEEPTISLSRNKKESPIYDPAKNCELVGIDLSYNIQKPVSGNKYSVLVNGVLREVKNNKFTIRVPFPAPAIPFSFEAIVKDENGFETRKPEEVPTSVLNLSDQKVATVTIENPPDGNPPVVHPGDPDELLFIASPAGGKISLQLNGAIVNVPFDAIGPCEKPKYKLDTLNLDPGLYTVKYNFNTLTDETKFKVVDADTPAEVAAAAKKAANKAAKEAKAAAAAAKTAAADAAKAAADAKKLADAKNVSSGPTKFKSRSIPKKEVRASVKAPAKGAVKKKAVGKTKAVPVTKKTVSKKKTAPAKPKSAAKKKPTSKKKDNGHTVLLNQRMARHRESMKVAEADSSIAKTKSFGLAMSFVLFPGNNVKMLDSRFEEASNSLVASIKRSSGEKEKTYHHLMETLLHNYLDKQVVLQKDALSQRTSTLLEGQITKLKASGFDVVQSKKSWKGSALKKALDADVVNAIHKMMK